jgi:hypothetical protein
VRHRRSVWLTVAATAVALGAALPSGALAAFPGRDGELVVAPARGSGLLLVGPNGNGGHLVCTDIKRCGRPVWPRWSPDGREIVFEDAASGAIETLRAGGTCVSCVGSSAPATPKGSHPAFTSDGTAVTFVRRHGSSQGLWRLGQGNAPSSRLTKLALTDAVWSSTGELASVRSGSLWVQPAGSDRLRRLVGGVSPSWSPDGSQVAVARDGWIWVVRARDGASRRAGERLRAGVVAERSASGLRGFRRFRFGDQSIWRGSATGGSGPRSLDRLAAAPRLAPGRSRFTRIGRRDTPGSGSATAPGSGDAMPPGPGAGMSPLPAPCTPPAGSTVLASDADVVIWSQPDTIPYVSSPAISWYGCAFATGQPSFLLMADPGLGNGADFEDIALSGPIVAFFSDTTDRWMGISQSVTTVDLSTGGQLYSTEACPLSSDWPTNGSGYPVPGACLIPWWSIPAGSRLGT